MGNLWLETPLIHSPHISARLGCNVYLKLESLQPSQSFKYRGISHFIRRALAEHGPTVHLIIASGGNAGLAAACAAHALNLRCTVYLPRGAGTPSIMQFFRQANADVQEEGNYYAQTLQTAKEAVVSSPKAVLVPAYEDPILWEGHSSMINEIAKQIPGNQKPDAIFCSVGGGGLIGGVMYGCKTVGWDDVPVVALETFGSNCFYRSLALNPGPFIEDRSNSDNIEVLEDAEHNIKIARLANITSRAASLGASSPAPGVVRMALERAGGVKSVCVPDEFSMYAGLQFSEEHKMLVELACATTLIPAYSEELFERLVPRKTDGEDRTVVFIVCGGFKIAMSEMLEYQALVADKSRKEADHWEVYCNGERWSIGTRPRSPPLTVEYILKLGMDFIVRTLIARFFGVLWVILAWFGLKFPQRPSVANEEKENADEESVDEEHIEKQPSFANEPAAEEQPQLDTTVVTLIDTIEEVPEETTEDVSEEPDTKPRPSPLASRRACFAADALSQAVALLIRSPFVDGKPAIPQFSITFDGQSIDNFKMGPLSTPAKSETALHLVVFDGTVLGGKVELMLN